MKSLPETIVDFHVHLFPDRLFRAIWKSFVSLYGWNVLYPLFHRQCIDYLRQQGVGTIVYSNYAHRAGVAESLNHWNRSLLEETENLYCFAAYHPDDGDALAMAKALVNVPRIVGFKLHLQVQQIYAHDERLFPLYELVMEKEKHILFHAGSGPVGNEFVGFDHFSRLLKRYPALPCTVAHMGGLEYGDFMELLDRYPNLYLDTSFSFFPAARSGQTMGFDLSPDYLIRYCDRILYGSDFPNLIVPREDEIETLLSLGLSDEAYWKIFRTNAESLLGECCPLPPRERVKEC